MEAHAAAGRIPPDAVEPVRAAPAPTPEAVAEIEAVTQHDVIAFLTAWADQTEPRSAAAYVHFGMTSSDLLDTALALQLVEATDVMLTKADQLVASLRELGLRHRATLRVGRTHGIHGEPTVFGHRVADLAFGMARCRDRLRAARADVAVAKISGAVGTYSNIDTDVETYVAERARPHPSARRDPGGAARRHRELGGGAGRDRDGLRGGRPRGAPRPAHRGQGAVRTVRFRAEGLVGDAPQEEPDHVGAHRRPGAHRPSPVRPGPRGRAAVARAGHLALLDRARRPAGRRRRRRTTC